MLSMLPQGGGMQSLSYCPQSDLRHCGVGMLTNVVKLFHDGVVNGEPAPWLVDYAVELGCTIEDIGLALRAFAVGFSNTLVDPDADLGDALAAAGFTAMPRRLQEAIVAQIGRQAIGMTIYAMRDDVPLGEGGHEAALTRLVASGTAAALALGVRP